MSTFILLSGFDREGFFATVAKELTTTITDTGSLLFIASTPSEFKKIDEYTQRIFRYFGDIGIGFNGYAVLDNRMRDSEQVGAIERASCIFLMGGRAEVQLGYLRQQRLIEPLFHHKGVVIGLSAGAINMAKRSVIANPSYPPVRIYEGMGLVDVTVIPHFDGINTDYIKNEIFPLTHQGKIYGICEDGVIMIQNGFKKHSGTVYELTPGNMKLLSDKDTI